MTNTSNTDSRWTRETLLSLHWWSQTLFSFRVSRPTDYRFVAGQYSRLGLEHEGSLIWRAYSLVSAPHDESLEYYGVLVPQGPFTSTLKTMSPGQSLLLDRQVFGVMTADRFGPSPDCTLWMMATGTGIGPYISMLREGSVFTQFGRIVLVHGVRTQEERAYLEELRAMASANTPLQLIACVSREAPSQADAIPGRITSALEDGSLESAASCRLEAQHSRVMLCGNPEMVESLRAMLHAREMRPVRRVSGGQFLTENYW